MEILLEKNETPIDNPVCIDWNVCYEYVPYNLGDPDEDDDYFSILELHKSPSNQSTLEIPELQPSNKTMYETTMKHLFENGAEYEKTILQQLITYTFEDKEDGEGFYYAKALAEKRERKTYSKEAFIKRSCALSSILLNDIEKDGLHYITFNFYCAWDEEHDVAVICHNRKGMVTGQIGDFAGRNGENLLHTIQLMLQKKR